MIDPIRALARNTALLVAVLLAACSGKTESPPAAASAPAAVPAPPPAPAGDPKLATAKALDEDRIKKFLAYEQETIGVTIEMATVGMKAAVASGGDAKKMEKELSREEKLKQYNATLEAAAAKHGITVADDLAFQTLTGEYFVKEYVIGDTRKLVEENGRKQKAWDEMEAKEAKKKKDPRAPPWWMNKGNIRPLSKEMLEFHEKQLAEHEAFRKKFAETYGRPLIDLLDKYRDPFVELRGKLMAGFLGKPAKP